jgi:colanic acid biosynthesis glycosyl transferase WcaI
MNDVCKSSVLVISQYFHPEPTGSAPPISDLALWIAENDRPARVLTARPSYPDRRVFDGFRQGEKDRELWRDIDVRRFGSYVAKGGGLIDRLLTEGSFALRLIGARFERAGTPCERVISVCPSIFTAMVASLFVTRRGRHLIIVHDIQSGLGASLAGNGLAMRCLRFVERLVLNRADAIVTLSEGMRRALEELGVRAPITILPPQVDVRKLNGLPEPEGAPIVLYSGAFGKKQGLDQVLDAAAVLSAASSDVRFVLRGQGGVESELRDRCSRDNLSNVSIQPLAPLELMNEAMAHGAIHLVPQAAAGADFAVPSKVFSIMSAARPFIATAHPGSPLASLIESSGSGLYVAPDDPQALADGILALSQDHELRKRLGQAGRRYVEQHVDREVVCKLIMDALDGTDAPD